MAGRTSSRKDCAALEMVNRTENAKVAKARKGRKEIRSAE
jgi:hypothetical protein